MGKIFLMLTIKKHKLSSNGFAKTAAQPSMGIFSPFAGQKSCNLLLIARIFLRQAFLKNIADKRPEKAVVQTAC